MKKTTRQRGNIVIGLIIGLVLGLGVALGIAVYVTKVPIPFVTKTQRGGAEQDEAEARKNRDWDPNAPLAGANCTVYLRADAVGIQFTGANMEFRNLTSRRGTFVRCDEHWLVLKNESQEVWVPRTSIALLEVR